MPKNLPENLVFQWGEPQYDDGSTKSLHAVIGTEIVGFLDIYPLPTNEFGIGQVTVKPEWWRRGIATALFLEARKTLPNLVAHSYDFTVAGTKWVNSLPT